VATVTLDIVIVNWNAGRQLRACLESIARAGRHGLDLGRVVVVDNASSDGSQVGLEDVPLPLVVLWNAENRGFAAACNQGAKEGQGSYLLFLNPDVRLFGDSLAAPLAFMESGAARHIGILGVQLVNDAGAVSPSCTRFPTAGMFLRKIGGLDLLWPRTFPGLLMREWDHGSSREVDQVMGAFFLVRRAVYEALGGFDERFFVYFEDLDFALRARKAGFRSFYLATVQAYHKGAGTSAQAVPARLRYSLESRIRYCYKHFSVAGALAVAAATLLVEPVARVAMCLASRRRGRAADTLKGFAKLWASMLHLGWREISIIMTRCPGVTLVCKRPRRLDRKPEEPA